MDPQMIYHLFPMTYPQVESRARRRWVERELQLQRRAARRAARHRWLRRGRPTPAPSIPSVA